MGTEMYDTVPFFNNNCNMKKTALFLLMFVVATMAMAKPVPQSQLNRICEHFFSGATTMQPLGDNGEMMLYRPVGSQGFLLLATDDCVRPVLAYSYTGRFDLEDMPEHILHWLKGYERNIASCVAAGVEASPEVAAEWQRWLRGAPKSSGNQVGPLLTTTWGQFPYYNVMCPYDTAHNDHVKVGCVAVAIGQIMKYWNYPATGLGSYTYNSMLYINGETYTFDSVSADFGAATYDWEHMPDSLNAFSDSVSVNAVAQLLFHAGVSVGMLYSYFGSAALSGSYDDFNSRCAENALRYNFKYDQRLHIINKNEFSNCQWIGILRNDLDLGQPIYYAAEDPNIGGHAFVIDGYDSLGFFHINWGWKTECDGYFLIDSLTSTRYSGVVFNFSDWCTAIVGIRPMDSFDTTAPVVINVVSSDTTMGTVTGGGTYTALADTVMINAHATEGHRLARWSSGNMNNPRYILAMGSFTDTAIFEPLHGDTLAYCGNEIWTYWIPYEDNTADWGIRLPSSVIPLHKELTAVQFAVYDNAPYELRVYLGDSITDATLAYTQMFDTLQFTGPFEWYTLELNTPLVIPANTTVWVTFHVEDCTGILPAIGGRYTGNEDGAWYRGINGWTTFDIYEVYTWQIRAITQSTDKVHLAVSPNDINRGDVYGGGYFWPGDTVMLTAVPKTGYRFSYWSNESTDNPLTFVITSDTTFIAFFDPINGISDLESDGLTLTLYERTLTVDNLSGDMVSVYDVQGRCLSSFRTLHATVHFPAAGVYMIKAEGCKAKKIIVY